jgi:hypothetical protein
MAATWSSAGWYGNDGGDPCLYRDDCMVGKPQAEKNQMIAARLIALLFVLGFVTSACIVDGSHEHHHYGWWH